jgi:hypothetical protein
MLKSTLAVQVVFGSEICEAKRTDMEYLLLDSSQTGGTTACDCPDRTLSSARLAESFFCMDALPQQDLCMTFRGHYKRSRISNRSTEGGRPGDLHKNGSGLNSKAFPCMNEASVR